MAINSISKLFDWNSKQIKKSEIERLVEDNNYLVSAIKKLYQVSKVIECYGMYGVKCKGVVIKEFYKHSCLRYGIEVFIENHGNRFIELDEIINP